MKSFKSLSFYLTILLVVLSVLVENTEARRRVLRGRRVMTRPYYRGNAIPAWAIATLVGIGMLVVGGALYAVMRKFVLSAETGTSNTGNLNLYQPAMQNEV